jgi:hypothetical protein
MRPYIDDASVSILRRTVPEFETCYLDMLDIYDEDLTPQVVFTELADFVSNLLDEGESSEVVKKCVAALETIATTPGVDPAETVGYSFLDGLRPDILDQIGEYLGPAVERVLADLESGELELQDEELSAEDLADIAELEAAGRLAPGSTASLSLTSPAESPRTSARRR